MIRSIFFDYGGTLDTSGQHWAEVIWRGYRRLAIPVSYNDYWLAYVHGERTLAKFPLIQPQHNFLDLLRIKLNIQTSFLVDAKFWTTPAQAELFPTGTVQESHRQQVAEQIATYCYEKVCRQMNQTRTVLAALSEHYPLTLVSNFYGNLKAVLSDFSLDTYFTHVVESAIVGYRKPDPRIFQAAIDLQDAAPDEILVVGDSYTKDILPAHSLGCLTAWLNPTEKVSASSDKENEATYTIHNLDQLQSLLS